MHRFLRAVAASTSRRTPASSSASRPDVARRINLPSWRPELTVDTIERLSQLSLEYGLIERRPDLRQLIRR